MGGPPWLWDGNQQGVFFLRELRVQVRGTTHPSLPPTVPVLALKVLCVLGDPLVWVKLEVGHPRRGRYSDFPGSLASRSWWGLGWEL